MLIILLWSLGVVLAQGTEEVQSHWKLNDDLERLAAVRPGPPPTSGGAAATPPRPGWGQLCQPPQFFPSPSSLPAQTAVGAWGDGDGGEDSARAFLIDLSEPRLCSPLQLPEQGTSPGPDASGFAGFAVLRTVSSALPRGKFFTKDRPKA